MFDVRSGRGLLPRLSGVAISFLLLGAACGDDTSEDSATTPEEPTETSEESTSATSGEPPIRLGVISGHNVGSAGEQTESGARAAEAALNDGGGVNGRRISVEICGDEGDANVAARCARDFAADEDVVALVGVNSNYQDGIDPVLEEAGLPSVGHSLLGAPDYESPMVFPVNGGPLISTSAGGPICINELDAASVALAHLDLAVGAQLVAVLNGFSLAPFGMELARAVPVPTTATDVTAQAAEIIASDADCTIILAGAESVAQMVVALRQQGYEGEIAVPGAVFSPQALVEAVGEDDAEGVVVTQAFDYTSPLAEEYLSDMEAIGASELVSDLSLQAWLAVKVVADVAGELEQIDRRSLLTALEGVSAFDTEGLTAEPLDFTGREADPAVLGGSAPNLILPYALAAQIRDGEAEPVTGEWQHAFAGSDQ